MQTIPLDRPHRDRLLRFSTVVEPHQFKFAKLSQFFAFKSLPVKDIGYYYEYNHKTFFYCETETPASADRVFHYKELAQLEFSRLTDLEADQVSTIQKLQENNCVIVRTKGYTVLRDDELLAFFGQFGLVVFHKVVSPNEALVKYLSQSMAETCLAQCQYHEVYAVEAVAKSLDERPLLQQAPRTIPRFKLSHPLMEATKISQFETVKNRLTKSDNKMEDSGVLQNTMHTFGLNSSVHGNHQANFDDVFNTNTSGNLPLPFQDLRDIQRMREAKSKGNSHGSDLSQPMLFSSDEDDDGFSKLI